LIAPVRVHRERPRAPDLREARAHTTARLAGLDPAVPGERRRVEPAETRRDLARRLVAQLMAARAAVGVDDLAYPLALALDVRRNAVAGRPGAGEVALRWQLQQREPIERRIVF